jgi:hypothetical protein
MQNKTFLSFILMLLLSASPGYGQNLVSNLQKGLMSRNPFETWLPKTEEMIEEKIIEKIEEKIEKPQEQVKIIDSNVPARKMIGKEEMDKPAEELTPPELKINGLVWNTDKPQAIINDQVVVIGDMVGDSKVIDIRKDGVDLMFLNKPFTVQMEQAVTQST